MIEKEVALKCSRSEWFPARTLHQLQMERFRFAFFGGGSTFRKQDVVGPILENRQPLT